MSERTTSHCFQKSRLQDLSLCDEAHCGWSNILDDESLKTAIEEDNNSQTCREHTKYFQVSNEMVKLHLYNIGKVYKLSKWVPHSRKSTSKSLSRSFLSPAKYPYLIKCSPVMKSESCMTLPSVPDTTRPPLQ